MAAETPIDRLTHAVRSTCATLMDAAERLRRLPDAERQELVGLMLPRAERVVELLKKFRQEGTGT